MKCCSDEMSRVTRCLVTVLTMLFVAYKFVSRCMCNCLQPQIIRRHGYSAEQHTVETKDGYLLEMHRIPYGTKENLDGTARPVVFLQHGVVSSSVDFVIPGPQKALAFVLADNGFDVWMGNARGTSYSRAHVKFSPEDKEFWQFTWNEIACEDLPAEIDHILSVTGVEQISYIGHSMGTTVFFAMLSEKPEYNNKIKIAITMAPVAFLEHMSSPIRFFTPFLSELKTIYSEFSNGQFPVHYDFIMRFVSKYFCDADDSLCETIIFAVAGYDKKEMNATLIPDILAHSPDTTSINTLVHFGQLQLSGRFAKFDYGQKENLKVYNATLPPSYNLTQVKVPVTLMWGDNDLIADERDMKRLKAALSNSTLYTVPYHGFNHMDFLYAIDAPTLVNEQVLKVLSGTEERSVDNIIR